ncbi:MAG TPA: trypsin-like peptidase domain-containing protein, partial [bacterium]|nr:trypsin-like peptidase domain-containing protein [bacterium]
MRMIVVGLVLAALVAPAAAQPLPAVESVDAAVVHLGVLLESGGRLVRGSGSGIIVEPDGLILTAAHVINRARQIEVTLRSGDIYPATVVGTDPVFDSALIKITPAAPLPVAALGDAGTLA